MFYNIRFFPALILFMGFMYLTFEGIFIISRQSVRIPFQRRKYFEGRIAVGIGVVSILMGVYCLAALVSMYFEAV